MRAVDSPAARLCSLPVTQAATITTIALLVVWTLIGFTLGALFGHARERLYWQRRSSGWLSQIQASARDPLVTPRLLSMHIARLRAELGPMPLEHFIDDEPPTKR